MRERERDSVEESTKLDLIYEEQERRLREMEFMFQRRVDSKDQEIRGLKGDLAARDLKLQGELNKLRDQHQKEIQQIQDKVDLVLEKPKEVI